MPIQGKTMQTKTALVVDDSRVARLTLSKLLQAQGFSVLEQGSGEEALQWLQQAVPVPDIIFMDVMMPGIDGLAATREIKAVSALSAIPVVVCTGKDSEADLQQALASGAAAVLSKPPAAEALTQLLASITLAETETTARDDQTVPASVMPSTADLLQDVRDQLWPELEQKLAATIAPLEQRLNQHTEVQSDNRGDALAEISQTLMVNLQQQFSELTQGFENKANEVVSTTADAAISSAMNQFGLSDKLNALLNSEGKDWLNQQEAQLKNSLEQELKPALVGSLESELEATVSQHVQVQLSDQVQRQQQELLAQQHAALEFVKKQLGMQRNIAIGAVLVAVAALIVALI
jgi:CheY-like chemotaxis protein